MPAPYALGARLRVLGKLHGQDCIQVLHFGTNTAVSDQGATDALILALLTAMLSCVTDMLLPAVTIEYNLLGVEATPIFPTKGDPTFLPAEASAHGEKGACSASFLASLIEVRTGVGGRTHRGRNFWPPSGESNTNVSQLDSDTITDLNNFIQCVIGKFGKTAGTEQWRFGVLSRKGATTTDTKFDTNFTECTSMVASQFVAKMGSRKVGKGS